MNEKKAFLDELNTPEIKVHPKPAPVFAVSGTHREMGRQIGEAARKQIRNSIENARRLIASAESILELDWEGALMQSRKYLPFAEERYPQYVEEMAGIAEGAGVSFDDISTVNAMEAVTSDALHLEKCTSMAVNDSRTADGHVLVAHNEDWLPWDEDDVFLIHATPADEPPFLAMTYGGLLPNIGFNGYGISQCCDSVYPTDSRIGIPRIIVSRAVLAARTIGDAVRAMLVPQRAAGYNHLLVHDSGEMFSIEVSARRFAILSDEDGYIAHTNHYHDRRMQEIEDEPDELISTRIRYHRAVRMLKANTQHSIKTLQTIQRDHINYPDSICRHDINGSQPIDAQKTINALIMDLTARTIAFAWGSPCQNQYHTYHLNT